MPAAYSDDEGYTSCGEEDLQDGEDASDGELHDSLQASAGMCCLAFLSPHSVLCIVRSGVRFTCSVCCADDLEARQAAEETMDQRDARLRLEWMEQEEIEAEVEAQIEAEVSL